ncbi:MAG: hypothetical protein IPH00_14645 [Flavobacteriales bacterium]|nr:hypothetical protein [Flavobacteriales bacterium]
MAESRLRIGIIGEAEKLRHWQGQCMQALLEVPGIELVFLAETADAQHEEKTSILYRRWSGRRSPAKALERAGSPGLLNGLPRIPFGGGPSSAELEKLRGFHPDVLLQLSSAELPESFHNLPRLGTWRFIHGERLPGADEIPGLRETLNGDPVVSVSLQRSPNGQGSGSVLRSGCFGAGGRSVDEIAETVLQCCAEWPAQVCWALISGDPEAAIGTEADPLTPVRPFSLQCGNAPAMVETACRRKTVHQGIRTGGMELRRASTTHCVTAGGQTEPERALAAAAGQRPMAIDTLRDLHGRQVEHAVREA